MQLWVPAQRARRRSGILMARYACRPPASKRTLCAGYEVFVLRHVFASGSTFARD